METAEELREALVECRRELDALRLEGRHSRMLLDAIGSLLTSTLDDDPFEVLFRALEIVFTFSRLLVLAEQEGEAGELHCIAAHPGGLRGSTWPVGRLFGKVLNGRVSTTLDNAALPEWQGDLPAGLSPAQPALYLPMRVRERRGMLVLLREEGGPGFDRGDVALARNFSLLASAAFAALYTRQRELESRRLRQLTERLQRSEKALAHRAYFDQLTGLPNRQTIEERVQEAIAGLPEGESLALAFIDIDDFKKVNDFHNHSVGDALLIAVAERIRRAVRGRDVLGRISGDEFVLMLVAPGDRQQTAVIVDRIVEQLRQPFRVEGRELFTSASIGVSTYPEHGSDYEALRRNADLAMYRAKKFAKGSACFFDTWLGDATSARMQLEQDLRVAVRERRFRCAFQPKLALATGAVAGFEALVRWQDNAGSMRAPGAFLPVATEMGLLNEISEIVLEEIQDSLEALDRRFGGGTRISVNVAASQVSDAIFMDRLIGRIIDSGRRERFVLEITEEAVVQPEPFVTSILPILRREGIGLSIDDFGTGYSSFSVLADITADELKVDRSYITAIQDRPRSQGILRAVDSLGAALGMAVVAEGVETAEELDYLQRHTGIGFVQGYHFCRPMLLPDLVAAELPEVAVPAAARRMAT
ncbi:putative bifunctional diguanylate cyclase/phosphodiesterase [Marinibaculum pumilum]|uniref:Bifunctional diguanylate cyclase/phosphodiesterase n=1 Tax=Marinibaculum pumilum TaxID=1766165 RepID=A0ABV7L0R1_9PROT